MMQPDALELQAQAGHHFLRAVDSILAARKAAEDDLRIAVTFRGGKEPGIAENDIQIARIALKNIKDTHARLIKGFERDAHGALLDYPMEAK